MNILSTERLHLRWLAHEDSEFIIELLNDRSFIDNIADRKVRTTEDAKKYIDKIRKNYETQGYGFFLVSDHSGNKLGICGVIHRDGLKHPDIGFAFLPGYTGKGYAYESSRALLEKATRDWAIQTISAIVTPGNQRSVHLLKKLGFSFSGKVTVTNEEIDLYICDKDAHNRFQAIFQQSAIAIQIYNRQGYTVAVNEAWEKLFQSKRDDLKDYNVLEDPQVHETGVIEFFRRAFGGEVVHAPGTYYDPAKSGKVGRARWLESIFSPVKDDKGNVYEVAIVFTDITDLKLAEEKVARSHHQLKIIFDHLPEAILVQDKEFKVVYANPVAVKLAGVKSAEDWTSQNAAVDHYEYFKEDGTPFQIDELPSRRVLRGEVIPNEIIMRYRHKVTGVEKTSLVLTRAILDDDGRPFQAVSVFHDITDKIRIETELREALDARNLFFSVASHELRTPITAMKLNTQLMHLTYPQITLDAIAKLDRQVGKLSKLVDDMLDISRLSRGRLELNKRETNLAQLTREVLYGMMDQLKLAGITLTISAPEAVMGHWDSDRLEQVVENLVTNAIRYARKTPLFVRVAESQEKVILEVCDQGPGIPPEDHDKIFNQFERSRSLGERSGMGLGLFIVREIVTLHGGTISVSNLNTGGARFIVELPRMRG